MKCNSSTTCIAGEDQIGGCAMRADHSEGPAEGAKNFSVSCFFADVVVNRETAGAAQDRASQPNNDTFAERSECDFRGVNGGFRFLLQIGKISVHSFLEQLLASFAEFRAGPGVVHVRGDWEGRSRLRCKCEKEQWE